MAILVIMFGFLCRSNYILQSYRTGNQEEENHKLAFDQMNLTTQANRFIVKKLSLSPSPKLPKKDLDFEVLALQKNRLKV